MITASAPGSIMVTGEHAVVHGYAALVAAIDQRAHVSVSGRPGPEIEIHSALGNLTAPLGELRAEGPLRFVVACLLAIEPNEGLRIQITSDIDPTLGLGSSAAVTIAALGALAQLTGKAVDLHAEALTIVRTLQGRGSGADLAASLHGGLVRYQLGHPTEKLSMPPALSLKYVGYKTPTGDVLKQVEEAWMGRDASELYARMGKASDAAIAAAKARDWATMAAALDEYQGLMVELGVSDPALDALVEAGRGEALAAKISGSGLGDCVLAFGGVPHGWERAKVAGQGLMIHD